MTDADVNSTGRLLVFCGPTLSGDEVRTSLPAATVLPPVAHGDLIRLGAKRGDVVAIIDGHWYQKGAVRHKEILALLDAGVTVYGASSMGALRAAELDRFGMIGVGRVYELLASGAIEGDDEVAVLHAPASEGFRALSEALVDIRINCEEAVNAGVLTDAEARAIVDAGAEMPFDRRTYASVTDAAVKSGLDRVRAHSFRAFVERRGRSVKRADALELLGRLSGGLMNAIRRGRPSFELSRTVFLHGWEELSKPPARPSLPSDQVLLTYCKIMAFDYDRFHHRVALEALASFFARDLEGRISTNQDLLEEHQTAEGLGTPDAMAAWLHDRLMSPSELLEYLKFKAQVLSVARHQGVEEEPGRVSTEALEELAHRYAKARGFAGSDEDDTWGSAWLRTSENGVLRGAARIARVATRTFRLAPGASYLAPFVWQLKARGIFGLIQEDVKLMRDFRRRERATPREASPNQNHALRWAAERWGLPEVDEYALLDRGLVAIEKVALGENVTQTFARRATTYYEWVQREGDIRRLGVTTGAIEQTA